MKVLKDNLQVIGREGNGVPRRIENDNLLWQFLKNTQQKNRRICSIPILWNTFSRIPNFSTGRPTSKTIYCQKCIPVFQTDINSKLIFSRIMLFIVEI